VVIVHADRDGPGVVGSALVESGYRVETVRCDLGGELPVADDVAGLVVTGSSMGVHDPEAHPWLVGERVLLSDAVESGTPVIAIALGAEQLAVALGAEVTAGVVEAGIGEVVLTPAGRRDPVLGPEYGGLAATAVPCLHWHGDSFSLPDGAVHLAASRDTPHQAFRYGSRAYGFQFHLEVDAELARAWADRLPDGVVLDPAALSRVETVGRRLARRLVDTVTR
jgi:GMP synthase (glutamine-hydrolysing)